MTDDDRRRVVHRLQWYARRNASVRRPDLELRRKYRGYYRKGHEVRLVAYSDAELAEMLCLLRLLGFSAGRPHHTVNRHYLPLYGAEQVRRFVLDIWHADDPQGQMRHAIPLSVC
jgi:hypothetical protein